MIDNEKLGPYLLWNGSQCFENFPAYYTTDSAVVGPFVVVRDKNGVADLKPLLSMEQRANAQIE